MSWRVRTRVRNVNRAAVPYRPPPEPGVGSDAKSVSSSRASAALTAAPDRTEPSRIPDIRALVGVEGDGCAAKVEVVRGTAQVDVDRGEAGCAAAAAEVAEVERGCAAAAGAAAAGGGGGA